MWLAFTYVTGNRMPIIREAGSVETIVAIDPLFFGPALVGSFGDVGSGGLD